MRRRNGYPVNPLDHFELSLPALRENSLGDPSSRAVSVWRPRDVPTAGIPMLICLAAYLNSGPSLTGWRAFGENLPERLDRLYASGALTPVAVVFVDSYSRLGGTQYVDSPVIGNWPAALADDLVPAIEARYGCGGVGHRGLFGHSSGGFGALYNLAARPDVWSAAASHAGDCGFDLVYRPDLPKALRVLSDHNFSIDDFLTAFWQEEKPKGDQISALMMLAMAASYDPPGHEAHDAPPAAARDYGLSLPVTPDTCTLIEARWNRWIAFDPLVFLPQKTQHLRRSRLIYFDCGTHDEYNILYGSRRLSQELSDADIDHQFETFDGGHGSIGPRYEVSIPRMAKALL